MRPTFTSIALPLLLLVAFAAGCAAGDPPMRTDAGRDAQVIFPDAGPDDAGPIGDDAGPDDAGPIGDDAGMDGGPTDVDAGSDAGAVGVDAGTDAGPTGTCPALSAGDTLALDGMSDLAKYPTSQRLTPGGMLGSADLLAVTWDRDYLYVTLDSAAFADEFKPLHIYLETGSPLGSAVPSMGKEYDMETAELPFTATHLIALRRTSMGVGGPYNGIYTPGAAWTTYAMELADGTDVWSSTSSISARVPWSAIGCATHIRMTAHVVNAVAGNEWKDFVPLSAEPWMAPGGGYFEIDLTADPAVSGWSEI